MSPTKSNTTKRRKRRTFRRRDYRAEYRRRIAKGEAAGKSRSVARGHPRAADLPKLPPGPIERDDPRERALKMMRRGASQAEAARVSGVPVEQLRRYRLLNTASERQGAKWLIFDSRPQPFWIASDGRMRSVTLANDEGSGVGHYWSAINEFLASNDADYLEPFIGEGVYDVRDKFWPFETRPNVLRKMDSVGELHFIEIYAEVAKSREGGRSEIEIALLHQKVRHAGLHRLGGIPDINCLCGETDPACFEREHIGRKKYDGTVWGRCCNCHRKITARQLMISPGVGLPPENVFNRMGHGFLGRYEYDRFNANFMLQSAELMFKLESKGIKFED